MNLPRTNRFNTYQIQMIVLGTILAITIIFFIINRQNITKLEREYERINSELYLKEITYQKRIKQFEEQAKKNRKQVETLKRDIQSKLE